MGQKLLLPEKTSELSKLQQGWLLLAQERVNTFDELQKDELRIQQLASEIERYGMVLGVTAPTPEQLIKYNEAHEKVKELLREMTTVYDTSKEKRLFFTNKIKEAIIDKAMDFEKRSDIKVSLSKQKEFALRSAIVQANEKNEAKNREIANLKAHIQNENHRRAAIYRQELGAMVTESYIRALEQKQDAKTIGAYIESIKGFMKDIKLYEFAKFNFTKLTVDEAKAIAKEIPKYDPAPDLKEYIDSVDAKFATYKADLKKADVVIEEVKQEHQQEVEQIQEELETETATNTLVAKAEEFTMTGGPTIKRKLEIVEENTEKWAFAVIAAFLKNANEAKGKLKTKTWSKLSIGQMAAALGAIATDDNSATFTGLQTVEIRK